MPEISTLASQATYVRTDKADTRFYTTAKRSLYVTTGSRYTYVYTPIDPRILGESITKATLRLVGAELVPGGGTPSFTARRHIDPTPTTYSVMTYANAPTPTGGTYTKSIDVAAVRTVEIDVTAEVQAIASGAAFYGWRITSNATYAHEFMGVETAGGPQLIVEYQRTVAAPANLSHGVVSVASPTVTWDPEDEAGDMQMVEIKIFDPTTSAELYSALEEQTVDGSYDLSSGPAIVLADNQTVDYQVRRRVGGVWSGWGYATITRKVKGTLTALAPAAGDPTPATGWTFTGRTQRAFRVQRYRLGKLIDDSGRIGGADNAYRLDQGASPSQPLCEDWIYVWDNVPDRIATPGDPTYRLEKIAWSANASSGEAPAVSAMSVYQIGTTPMTRIAWVSEDVAPPDEWLVWRNNRLVARFDGLDHKHPSEMKWSFTDCTAAPNADYTYEIVARTNRGAGVVLTDPVRQRLRLDVVGFWVLHPTTRTWFCLRGDERGLVQRESSAIYEPPFGQRAIKRHYALGGINGPVSGLIDSYHPDATLAEQVAAFDNFRLHPTWEFRAVWGDRNIPVILRNVTRDTSTEYATTDHVDQEVSFELHQSGEIEGDLAS